MVAVVDEGRRASDPYRSRLHPSANWHTRAAARRASSRCFLTSSCIQELAFRAYCLQELGILHGAHYLAHVGLPARAPPIAAARQLLLEEAA